MANDYLKFDKNCVNSILSTRKSEDGKTVPFINGNEMQMVEVSKKLSSSSFQFAGLFPYMACALAYTCGRNPTDASGNYLIGNQYNDDQTHFTYRYSMDDFFDASTDGYKVDKHQIKKEIKDLFLNGDDYTMYLNINGQGILTKPFIISSIFYDDAQSISQNASYSPSEKQSKLNKLERIKHLAKFEQARTMTGFDIQFFKPLFEASFAGSKNPFIFLTKAFYAKMQYTMWQVNNTPELRQQFMAWVYKDNDGKVLKYAPITYFKFYLYVMATKDLIIKRDGAAKYNLVDMLKHVDPNQLRQVGGHDVLKHYAKTEKFCAMACSLFNLMANFDFCKNDAGLITSCQIVNANEVQIGFVTDKKTRLPMLGYSTNVRVPANMTMIDSNIELI